MDAIKFAKAETLERRLSAKPPDDLDFISHELFTKLHACPPPSIAKSSNQKIWKERSFAKLYLLNDEHMEDPDLPHGIDSWTWSPLSGLR